MTDLGTGAGEVSDAIAWAGRAMALAPYDEKGIRRLMELLDRAGSRRIDEDAMHLRRALETAARFLRTNGRAGDAARYEARVAALPRGSS